MGFKEQNNRNRSRPQYSNQHQSPTLPGVPKLRSSPSNLIEWEEKLLIAMASKYGEIGRTLASNLTPEYVTLSMAEWIQLQINQNPQQQTPELQQLQLELEASLRSELVKEHRRLITTWRSTATQIFASLNLSLSNESLHMVQVDGTYVALQNASDFLGLFALIKRKHLFLGNAATFREKETHKEKLFAWKQLKSSLTDYNRHWARAVEQGRLMGIAWIQEELVYHYLLGLDPKRFFSDIYQMQTGTQEMPATLVEAFELMRHKDNAYSDCARKLGVDTKKSSVVANTFVKIHDEKDSDDGFKGKDSKGPGNKKAGKSGKKAAKYHCELCDKDGHTIDRCFKMQKFERLKAKSLNGGKVVNTAELGSNGADGKSEQQAASLHTSNTSNSSNPSNAIPRQASTIFRTCNVTSSVKITPSARLMNVLNIKPRKDTIIDTGANTNIFRDRSLIEGLHRLDHGVQIQGMGEVTLHNAGQHWICGEVFWDVHRNYNILCSSSLRDRWGLRYDGVSDTFHVGSLVFRRGLDNLYWLDIPLREVTRDMVTRTQQAHTAVVRDVLDDDDEDDNDHDADRSPILPIHTIDMNALLNDKKLVVTGKRYSLFGKAHACTEKYGDDVDISIPDNSSDSDDDEYFEKDHRYVFDSDEESDYDPDEIYSKMDETTALKVIVAKENKIMKNQARRRARENAARAREIHKSLHHPSDYRLGLLLDQTDGGISSKDLRNANKLFGPCPDCIAGKLKNLKFPDGKSEKYEDEQHATPGDQKLIHADIIFIYGYIFLFSIEDGTGYWHSVQLFSKDASEVVRALEEMVDYFARRDYAVKVVRTDRDGSFISAEERMSNIKLRFEYTATGRHEVIAERNVRTLRGYLRSTESQLKYKIPKSWIPYLMIDIVTTHNMLPNVRSGKLSPYNIVDKLYPNVCLHARFSFGAVVQVRDLNHVKFKTQRGVVLGRNINTKRSISVLLFGTNQIVNREPGVELFFTSEIHDELNNSIGD